MDPSVKLLKLWRRSTIALTLLLAVGCMTVVANAGHQTGTISSITACVNTTKGTLSNVAVGDAPKAPCGTNEQVVHLSGGDVTGVSAGTGLTGGASSGDATLGVNFGAFGSCPAGSAIRAIGPAAICEPDDDTRYFAGNGLTVPASSTFAVRPCNPGAILKNGGSGFGSAWNCATETQYSALDGLVKPSATSFGVRPCLPGQILKNNGSSFGGAWGCGTDFGSRYQIVEDDDVQPPYKHTSYAYCPEGLRVVGGGGHIVGQFGYGWLSRSAPITGGRGWEVGGSDSLYLPHNENRWGVKAYAICVDVGF